MIPSEYTAFLDDVSHCFLSADFQLWRSRIRIPLCVALPTGSKIIKTEREAHRLFQNSLTALQIQRIDGIIRSPVDLRECEDGIMLGTFETQLLARGLRVLEPFESSVMLRPVNSGLVASSILNFFEFSFGSNSHLRRVANFNTSSHQEITLLN